MSNYTNSLNELINTKKEIKDIIIESTGENPSEVFSYYPSYIRSAIATGGSTSEEVVNSYISAYLSTYNFIDQETLSSNSYITMGDVSACGYITSHQDLSSYATKSYVVDYVATYAPSPDLSGYVSKTELSAQSYLTSIPSEYITQNELSACGYITLADVPGTDLSNYVTYSYAYNTFVSYSYLGDIEEITEYILGSGSSSAPENIYATKTELGAYVSKTSLESMSYITMDDIDACGYITNSVTELEGPLFISRPDAGNGTYGFCSYTHIVAGTQDKTTVSFLASKRKCGGAEGSAYMSAFFVNSDGRSKFTHKSYTNKADVGLEADDAFLCFNAYGFKLSYSGTPGTAASTEYDLIHSGNINNYIPSSAVIDENIIPKENNTYTLGDFNHFYHSAYISRLRGDNSGIWLDTNTNHRYYAGSTSFRPYSNNQYTLGTSDINWAYTYTTNLILNGVNATEVFPSYSYINNVLGDIETLLSNI